MRLNKMEAALIQSLQQDRLLVERVERLMSIPAIGPITALTWALEIGEVRPFSSLKKAISYCGYEKPFSWNIWNNFESLRRQTESVARYFQKSSPTLVARRTYESRSSFRDSR